MPESDTLTPIRKITKRPRKPAVLFLADDPESLAAMRKLFKKAPLEVIATDSPSEALRRLDGPLVDVVIADEKMPGLSGAAFLRIVESRSPNSVRLIASAAPAELQEPDLVQHVLSKPWKEEEIRRILRTILGDQLPPEPEPPPPVPQDSGTARRPAGPEFMADQPVLVDCTKRSTSQIMSKLLLWLRRSRAEGRNVLLVLEGLPLLKDNPAALLADLVLGVEVTGVRLRLLEGTGLAAEFFRSGDAFHPRIEVPAEAETPKDLLLVDPVAARRVFLKLVLSAVGHRCRAVATAEEARAALDRDPVDLVFLEVADAEDQAIALVRDLARTGKGTGVVPLVSKPRAWAPLIARKWNLRPALVRPYAFTDLADAAR
jgi:CheY-like chemotaxis protein